MWLLIQMAPLAAKVKMLGIYLSLLFVYDNITRTLGHTKFLKVLKHSKKKFVYARRHVISSIYRSDRVCKNIPPLTQRQSHQRENIWPSPSLEGLPVNHLCGMDHFSNRVQQLTKIPRNTVNRDNLFKVLKETYEGINQSPLPLYIRGLNAVSTTKQFVLQPFSPGNEYFNGFIFTLRLYPLC